MDQKAIQTIKAKAGRIKLPLNEMAVLRWCVVAGGVGGVACAVVGWATGYLYVKPGQLVGMMPFAAIFGGMAGACIAVAIATVIKVTFNLTGRIADAFGPPDPLSDNELLGSPNRAGEMRKPNKTATQR